MADTGGGGGGAGGPPPPPPPPPPHTHTHTQDTKKNSLDFVLLTLLALDVQTLRTSFKAVDLLQRQSIVVVH